VLEGQRPDELILQGRGLAKTFGQGRTLTRAVDNVSIDLYAAQVAVLMGPSGSGKSTLLALLLGLLPPTAGRVIALGQDLWALSDQQRQEFRLRYCGFVFQGSNLFPAMSARQQIEMVLRLGDLVPAREARRRAEELLDLLELRDKAHLRPLELSGGEKQRIALARALIKNPAFIFADEPTASLDWVRGSQVVELLCEAARRRNACVFIVSHDPRLRSRADRVYNLDDGRLRDTEDEPDAGDIALEPGPTGRKAP
jgi:putative ABC transport system ATP-binding protein